MASLLNAEALRADFPILATEVNDHPLVYLDNAATTQKPRQVIEAISTFYATECANVHRGVHTLSQRATNHFEQVRRQVAAFVNAPAPEAVIFTKGTTEGVNLVMSSWARHNLEEGDEILLSYAEHHSNLVPWLMLAEELKLQLKYLPMVENYQLLLDYLDEPDILSQKTKLLAIQHMSNVTGTIHDIPRIVQAVREKSDAKILLDGAQSVPHIPVDFQALDIDFLVFSAHKMLGPSGVGVLVGKIEVLDAMPPFLGGGAMIKEVWFKKFSPGDLPYRFEAGTPNIEGVIGFGAALKYLEAVGLEAIHAHEQMLMAYARTQLEELDGINFFGPDTPENRGGILAFNLNGLHAQDLGELLDQQGIAIRTGHHCCQPLLRHYEQSSVARASFYLYNTQAEVDTLVKGIKRAQRLLSRAARR